MWNLKYDKNEHSCDRERLTDIESRLVGARRGDRVMNWEAGLADASHYMQDG